MTPCLTIKELTGLEPRHAQFVIEYIKDFNSGAASERAGYTREYGYKLLLMDSIQEAVAKVLQNRFDNSVIDAEWLETELVDNHYIARQSGKLSASNTALNILGKLAHIDAYAAEKVHIASDEEIKERLLRGRRRLGEEEVDFK